MRTSLIFIVKTVFIHPGDVEIGLMERNGGLEVEVVQARGLTMKPGSKGPPGELTHQSWDENQVKQFNESVMFN